MLCFALVEGTIFIIGKETSGESGKWRNVQRTGRNKNEGKSKNDKRMKGRRKDRSGHYGDELGGVYRPSAAADTLALFGCVVEVADWAGVTFQ